MVDILVSNGMIITFDQKRRIIKDGGIAVEDGEIVDGGKTKEIEKTCKGADALIEGAGFEFRPEWPVS